MSYLVAIVGRPNTGKSTLFNRLTGKKRAILSEIPGTTRDFFFGEVTWRKITFTIVDTAGIALANRKEMAQNILAQTMLAINDADLIIFLTDSKEGLQARDLEAAKLIRKTGKPVLLAANKTESKKGEGNLPDFYRLGLGEPVAISALQGKGVGDLLDLVTSELKSIKKPIRKKPKLPEIRIAILGRPNVGKSTLFNKLIGKKRSVENAVPGTTRDIIDESIELKNHQLTFIDTTGLRRRGRIQKGIEKYSALRVLKAIQEADICLLLIEGPEGTVAQDLHIAGFVLKENKGLILVVNKWDLMKKGVAPHDYQKYLDRRLRFADFVPILFVSAKTGKKVGTIFSTIMEVWQSRNQKITTKQLNNIILSAQTANSPKAKRRPRIYFARQVGVNPPTIQLKVNYPEQIHFTYLRYLENRIREIFPFIGTPIVWKLIKSSSKSLGK